MDYERSLEDLVDVVQELSMARSVEVVQTIVRAAARRLTGADGATFVLREGTRCYYADEEAIAPLWKGQRFPLEACISGWVMLNRLPATIEDIYRDPRIPADAYRPTFVKSLLMVPIRTRDPLGAIGNYWAAPHRPSPREVKLLSALADTAAVALENVQVYVELESRVRARTQELERTVGELKRARGEIRTLQGLIPVCAWCKRLRTDEGYWHDFESYVRLHSGYDFTHGICPACRTDEFSDPAGSTAG